MKKKFLVPEVKNVSMHPTTILTGSNKDPDGGEKPTEIEGGGAAKIGTGTKFQWN